MQQILTVMLRDAKRGLHVVCILKGSRGFFTALLKYLSNVTLYLQTQENPPFLEHYCRILPRKADGDDQDITIVSEDLSTLRGKNVLVIEDMINTGQTLGMFCNKMKTYEPYSLLVASLLEKENAKFKGDFVGFSVPDEFLVGFSLDHEERYRDLDHICVLSETGLKRQSVIEKESSPKAARVDAVI
jgi:hypoxanthine phosphoribosyltransferase